MARILELHDNPPADGRVVCVDEFGPLNPQPRMGKAWWPVGQQARQRAGEHNCRREFLDLLQDTAPSLVRLDTRQEALTMEYLVTMTTEVPDGTPGAAAQDIRTREAARSRELATQRHLLRLWRPPLQPGEWRTLGLFAADDAAQLEEVLASMPLRVWRTDEVTPLSPHPNDPPQQTEGPGAPAPEAGGSEFMTTFTLAVPAGTPRQDVDAINAREADRARELAGQGHLLRLWALPGEGRALGLWHVHDSAGMQTILASLPLYAWTSVRTTPLTPHPSDPAHTSS